MSWIVNRHSLKSVSDNVNNVFTSCFRRVLNVLSFDVQKLREKNVRLPTNEMTLLKRYFTWFSMDIGFKKYHKHDVDNLKTFSPVACKENEKMSPFSYSFILYIFPQGIFTRSLLTVTLMMFLAAQCFAISEKSRDAEEGSFHLFIFPLAWTLYRRPLHIVHEMY